MVKQAFLSNPFFRFFKTHPNIFLFAFFGLLTLFSFFFFDQGIALVFDGFSKRKIGYLFKAISQIASFQFWLPVLIFIWFCYIAAAGFSRSADSFYFFMVRSRQTLYVFCSFFLASSVAQFLRMVVNRYDPRDFLLSISADLQTVPWEEAASFPSLHVALTTALLCAMMFISNRRRPLYILIIFLISVSRLFLERNYLSDILFGMMIGFFSAKFLHAKFRKFIGVYQK